MRTRDAPGEQAMPTQPAEEHEAGDDAPQSPRATAADRHVGARIRERRVMLGLSQQQLAKLIGVTYQQAHKYERGANRISAGRLFGMAQALDVPVEWFFEGLARRAEAHLPPPRQRMCLEMVRNFALIEDAQMREALGNMARALAAQVRAAGGADDDGADEVP